MPHFVKETRMSALSKIIMTTASTATNLALLHIAMTPASNKKQKGETTSMEQCIVLLEPSLEVFRSSCVQKDKARAKKSKSRHIDTTDIDGGDNIINIDDSEDDEVPPQMLRLARFFQFRWLPVKRALLRPPPSPAGEEGTSASNNDISSGDIEVSIHYRLRLARACWKKGLVAAAEYESLKVAFDCRGAKRKRSTMIDGENGGQLKGQYKSDDSGTGKNDLMERVRLSLMRLPTDAIQPESERSTLAMRHVKEMILECCTYWEKKEKENNSRDNEDALGELTTFQVADWALTSWTALLLSRGMDNFTIHNSLSSAEMQLATLLSDRSSVNNPTLALARAVASRIDDILPPNNLGSLSGVHLYSLGKLFASFHSRRDAELHLITSIVKCSLERGVVGLEQLSRLLAVYSCCISAAVNFDDSIGHNAPRRRTTVKDLEGRLHDMLDEDGIVNTIVEGSDNDSYLEKRLPRDRRDVVFKAKSFLDTVLCATAHQCFAANKATTDS